MNKILLTFTGFQDPYALGLVGDEDQPGPILSLLSVRPFDQIFLISTPRTVKNTDQPINAIKGLYPKMRKAMEIGSALSTSESPIIIFCETGTGKELFAKFIHLMSGRFLDSFVPINCAAIPPELEESILFGHKKGAFTGAIKDQTGKFNQADGG